MTLLTVHNCLVFSNYGAFEAQKNRADVGVGFYGYGFVEHRDELLRSLWGDDDYFMGCSLDVFISRRRKRLTNDSSIPLEGVHGVGFRLTVRI